ncbi:MAG: hypothetical protein ACRDQ5_13545 [Sciscionella sp.]
MLTLLLILLGVVLLVIIAVRLVFAARSLSTARRRLTTRLGEGISVLRVHVAEVKAALGDLRRNDGTELDRTATAGSIEDQR